MRSASLVLACLLAAACDEHHFEEGPICPDADEVVAFAPGDVLEVRVVFNECISACARDVSASCDVSVEGDTIKLDARGSYRKPGRGACAAVCATLTATCMIEGLAPGTYTLESGEHTLELTLPADAPPEVDISCPGL